MSGYSPRDDDSDTDNNAEIIDELLDSINRMAGEEKRKTVSTSRNKGKFFRKIEQLREEKNLRDNLSDYDWDDI